MRIFRRAILLSVVALGCAACASKHDVPSATSAPAMNATQVSSEVAAAPAAPAGSAQATQTGPIASIDRSGTPLSLYSFVAPDYSAVMIAVIAPHPTGANSGSPRPKNGEYEVANVSIDVRSGTFTYDISQFRFLSANGQTYEPQQGTASTAGFGPTLEPGAVPAGKKVRGTVVFDVPTGGGQVQFFNGQGMQAGGWTVAS